jgi:hypothetical protein
LSLTHYLKNEFKPINFFIMKKPFKFFKLSAILVLLFAFYSCQEEDVLIENDIKSYELKTSRVSVNQVINEINSKEIRQTLQGKHYLTTQSTSLHRSSDSIPYFIKKEKDDELTTYILNINSYSQFTPYFLKFIITKNKDETERIGFLKYIPENQITTLDLETFTGECQILDINFEVTATSNYVDGAKQESTQNNTSNRVTCTNEIIITEVKCSHSGQHGVGQSCSPGYVNDAHYLVSVFTRCTGRPDHLVQIIEDTNPENNNGGGVFPATIFLNPFLQTLSDDQLLVYHSNPSIQTYLVDNLIVEQIPNYNPLLGGNPTRVVIRPEAEEFALELINLATLEPSQADVPNLVSLSFITKNHGLDNSLNNNYLNQIDPYVDLDLSSLSEENQELFLIKLQVKYQVLKASNPTWSEGTLVWETLKEVIHMGLDVLGLVPLLGEPADLLNGVLYSLDGDTLNASLSFASALPIVGYGSTATKFGLKAKNYYNAATNIASKEVLVWKITSNIISFGDRAQLRKVLGLGSFASNGLHAHHLIPWDFCNSAIVQKAAKSGDAWHMNDIINGIPLPSTNHLTGHNLYNNKIGQKLTQLNAISNTPQEAYVNLVNFTNQVKTLIQNNPNMNLGQIANLIN